MKELCTIDVSMMHYSKPCRVVVWEHGDPFPELGPTVGVDTETELITDTMLDPPVVVLGVFDPWHQTNWVVYWEDIPEFMNELCIRDVQQRYFNVGFDEQVIDNECPDKPVLLAAEAGRVRDMQVRVHINEVATLGWIRGNLYNLAGCALHFLNVKLDKGDPDKPEESARLTFRRYNPDGTKYRITPEQARYLPYDCISTWCLGEAIKDSPTEVVHTKGMIVLSHISANGIQVDPVMYRHFVQKLSTDRDEHLEKLLTFGFPDPRKRAKAPSATVAEEYAAVHTRFTALVGIDYPVPKSMPTRVAARRMLTYSYNFSDNPDECRDLEESVLYVLDDKDTNIKTAEKKLYEELMDLVDIQAFDASKKQIVMPMFVTKVLESFCDQKASGKADRQGYSIRDAIDYACDYMDEHPELLSTDKPLGPKAFFQNHVKKVLEENPKLELNRTEKSGDIQLTLKDMWRLQDLGIKDAFLDAYTGYGHCVKYLSTYLNPDNIKPDGKIHARFQGYLRTGRTSCTSPNLCN